MSAGPPVDHDAAPVAVGRLMSVNVGRPRDVQWEGRTVRTAVWKSALTGPVMVRWTNLDGDEQADKRGHGGEHRAVFVYQLDSYRYWAEQLRRDDFEPGQFGENFTVEGLEDDEVCIGDRYRIGDAVFEVTQPRVTCFRVGIRMQQPDMPSLLVAHHRPGFYLRVLTEGTVQAGQEIERVSVGPEQVTVADCDALLYLPHKSTQTLKRILRVPALSDGWRDSFEAMAAAPPPSPPAAWEGFAPMRVVDVRPESSTIISLRLVPVNEHAPEPSSEAGQYLTLRLMSGGEGRFADHPQLLDVPSRRPGWLPDQRPPACETAPAAATCTIASVAATSSARPPREAPSCCATGIARSCSSAPESVRPRCWRCCSHW